jgi:hypothetical protein
MKSLVESLKQNLYEAKTKTCPLGDVLFYFPGNHAYTSDKFNGESVGFNDWASAARDNDKALLKLFSEITGEKKFNEYISDSFLDKVMGFKAKGQKTLIMRGSGQKNDTEINVSKMGANYIAAAIEEIEIPASESGFKKFIDNGSFREAVMSKLSEYGIKNGAAKIGNIKGDILIVVDYEPRKSNGRHLNVSVIFSSFKTPRITLCNSTFLFKSEHEG